MFCGACGNNRTNRGGFQFAAARLPWFKKWTMGRMISFNTSSPYANANGRLRKWAKNNNISLK
ncbi:ClbS/DfsB family four-helix bundle protein [Escherichia coli]|uniref:ClbS/DfsB family four-helix bundle protein n=1 Tax=Escherichia coli TaxID=562 RepID=UPI003D6F15E3